MRFCVVSYHEKLCIDEKTYEEEILNFPCEIFFKIDPLFIESYLKGEDGTKIIIIYSNYGMFPVIIYVLNIIYVSFYLSFLPFS